MKVYKGKIRRADVPGETLDQQLNLLLAGAGLFKEILPVSGFTIAENTQYVVAMKRLYQLDEFKETTDSELDLETKVFTTVNDDKSINFEVAMEEGESIENALMWVVSHRSYVEAIDDILERIG